MNAGILTNHDGDEVDRAELIGTVELGFWRWVLLWNEVYLDIFLVLRHTMAYVFFFWGGAKRSRNPVERDALTVSWMERGNPRADPIKEDCLVVLTCSNMLQPIPRKRQHPSEYLNPLQEFVFLVLLTGILWLHTWLIISILKKLSCWRPSITPKVEHNSWNHKRSTDKTIDARSCPSLVTYLHPQSNI